MESILTSIKKMLGITAEYEHFDTDIIMHINSVFMDLNQLGVGPSSGFAIEDDEAYWTDFVEDLSLIQAVKSYMYLRVKILFDSASMGSATLSAYERQIAQWEWRLNVAVESDVSGDDSTTSTIPAVVNGTVVDCAKLNVRANPSSNAEVLTTVAVNAKVTIDISKSSGDWYYVHTTNGISGYCLKTNIRVHL